MPTAINIQQVKKEYNDVQALKGLSLQINKGEFFGLLGPNGAGKSTLISIMAGLTKPSAGYVEIEGHNVEHDFRMSRRHLGVVPQELVFDPFFTVEEVLRIQSGYFGLGKENYFWLDHLIESLGLASKAKTNMRSLSGGMKRRVLVAQALVHKPSVVVLDEPTAGVDVELRAALWEFISQLHTEGHTIVLTTHYLEEAESLCDRIAILNHGRIIALDTKEALLARNIEGAKRLIIVLSEPLKTVPQAITNYLIEHHLSKLTFDLRGDKTALYLIVNELEKVGITISSINSEQADLEDIFLDIMKEAMQ